MSDFPVLENPAKLKVAELKEELDKRGLPTGGLKKDVSLFHAYPALRTPCLADRAPERSRHG
jgi:hypothetical protein